MITLGTYLSLRDTVDVAIDGRTVIDPGDDADVVRITNIADPTNDYLAGIKRGVQGRVLLLFNATASTLHVAHDYDAQASVAQPSERLRMESGTYDLQPDAGKLLVHANGVRRVVGA